MPAPATMKVMIVDDQLSMRLLVRDGLQQLGFRDFDEAPDGEAALRLLVQQSAGPAVSLIVSDFNMPNLDGLALLRAVRVHPPISKTAFIMLTGRGDKDLVQRAVQYGVNNFLVKPFTIANLHEKVTAVFGSLK